MLYSVPLIPQAMPCTPAKYDIGKVVLFRPQKDGWGLFKYVFDQTLDPV